MENVSVALREGRISAGMTQRQLADALGITAAFLNDIEHGRRALGEKYVDLLPDGIREQVAGALLAEAEAKAEKWRRLV